MFTIDSRAGEENAAARPPDPPAPSCLGADYELALILKELRVITDQVYCIFNEIVILIHFVPIIPLGI